MKPIMPQIMQALLFLTTLESLS